MNSESLPILPLGADVEPAVLDLNNRHAVELSFLEPERLARMIGDAFCARRIGQVEAFLIAFDQDADYDSPNFQWFKARYSHFVYVDRVAVDPAARGKGHARRLYRHVFDRAATGGYPLVTCEVNEQPPNPASDAFHAAMGFEAIGAAALPGGAKSVRYFARPIGAPPPAST
ncbi:GNAT family N-acetyltransferase [Nitratireductor sp. CAU 1489]|uniref:GNAT family N-acetyltransferase n=1 Tax=Nitratireductor arenosus TaxID=2682096 RepID=A0A844Q9N5_9HYPH|nr:GNAT family N-acetyltransferase [Nitratireductor arenosus]MVA95945.1 GNAT family N-acetyltransferase [Nitratireductor arenosus]